MAPESPEAVAAGAHSPGGGGGKAWACTWSKRLLWRPTLHTPLNNGPSCLWQAHASADANRCSHTTLQLFRLSPCVQHQSFPQVCLRVVLICIFLVISDVQHLLMYILALCMSSLEKHLLELLPFLTELFVGFFLIVLEYSCVSFRYTACCVRFRYTAK